MHFFRKLIVHKKLSHLLLLGLLARSLIATGFMLDPNPAEGHLFSIIICEGPASINAIKGLSEQPRQDNQHQHHHHQHDDDEHNHEIQDHGFSACSFWSSSSQSLLANALFLDVADVRLTDEIVFYKTQPIPRTTNALRFPRAPPLLS
tara:strand:- start:395 stop:838 length:444 start_codon:yes stop_codon:yes gene_type:complete